MTTTKPASFTTSHDQVRHNQVPWQNRFAGVMAVALTVLVALAFSTLAHSVPPATAHDCTTAVGDIGRC